MATPPDQRLYDVLRKVSGRAREYRQQGLGEQNTKASLVEPVLECLGWDIRDPEEVHREFKPTSRASPVDYALKLMRKPRLFLEAKGLGESLADPKWVAQVLGYAVVAGVEWCVLSDGDEYRFYNATAPIPAEEKMFCRVKLTESQEPEAAKTLSLMSRGNLEQNLLDTLWVSHYVDRRVKVALGEMFAAPAKPIIRFVRRQVPKLTAKQVAESIRRLDVRFGPAVALPEIGQGPPAKPAATKGAKPAKKRKAPAGGAKVSLADLIGAGLLKPPVRLFKRYLKRDLEATVLPDGQVEFQGSRHATCSGAAEAARKTVTGLQMNTNGWTFWKYAERDGKSRELDGLRKAFRG